MKTVVPVLDTSGFIRPYRSPSIDAVVPVPLPLFTVLPSSRDPPDQVISPTSDHPPHLHGAEHQAEGEAERGGDPRPV